MTQRAKVAKHGDPDHKGPFTILQVFNNGTLQIQKRRYSDVVNIRQVMPYSAEI